MTIVVRHNGTLERQQAVLKAAYDLSRAPKRDRKQAARQVIAAANHLRGLHP